MKGLFCNQTVVKNILDGSQTQDRRPVRDHCLQSVDFDEICSEMNRPPFLRGNKWVYELQSAVDDTEFYEIKAPSQVGDILYVREKWHPLWEYCSPQTGIVGACWRFHGGGRVFNDKHKSHIHLDDTYPFRASTHMPKWAARIFLEVIEVKVELQDGIWYWIETRKQIERP